ncbi:uncharacterized protein [Rutidosis leptorrhynchoides]|uniref:uncharacterized protein n=1 Tax=Rutidosis leptorrhynchoides TaxID=125765 RepID=UPI003A992C3D
MPLLLAPAHSCSHPHALSLKFSSPYFPDIGFSCDICRQVGANHGLYRCDACQFDAHLHCATSSSSSFNNIDHVYGRRSSFPEAVIRGQLPNNYYHVNDQSTIMSNYNAYNNNGTGLVDNVVQGLVQGGAQQVGQSSVQSLTGTGDGIYVAADSSSSTISTVGSSIISGIFGLL